MSNKHGATIGLSVAIVIVIILMIVAVVFYILTYGKSVEKTEAIVLRPFSGFYGKSLTKSDGSPQLSCPSGSSINVISAVYEVYDPNLQCSSKSPWGGKTNDECNYPSPGPKLPLLSNVSKLGGCRIRDESATVSALANGKQKTNFEILATTFPNNPCTDVKDPTKLPIAASPYVLHGVYTCIPDPKKS